MGEPHRGLRAQVGGTGAQRQDGTPDSTADDRDEHLIDRIFSAGLLLRSGVALIEGSEAARHVERAVAALDDALREIRGTALARRHRLDG